MKLNTIRRFGSFVGFGCLFAAASTSACGQQCVYEPLVFCIDKAVMVSSCSASIPGLDASSVVASGDASTDAGDPLREVACPDVHVALACGPHGTAPDIQNYTGHPTDFGDTCCYEGFSSGPQCEGNP